MADSAYRYVGSLMSPHVITGRYTDGPGNVRTGGLPLTGAKSLNEWAPVANGGERNLRMWLLSFRNLQGMGGAQLYSGTESDITPTGTGLDSDPWMQWRGLHWFETNGLAAALAAEGAELGVTFWAANQTTATGFETPFARWERDDIWAGTIIPQITLFARACAAEGVTVIGIDGELYGYQTGPYGDTHDNAWTDNYHGRTCTTAQAHAFARQRGREVADAILAEMPGATWWSYYTALPYSNDSVIHGSDSYYLNNTSYDFIAGIASNPGWSQVVVADPSFYKDPQAWGNSPGMQQWSDAIRNGQMGQATGICAKLSDSEWDGIAAKLAFPPFIWLTPGSTIWEARLTYAQADPGIRAAVCTTVGGWWYLYTQQGGSGPDPVIEDDSPVGTGLDYDEYEPLLQAYGTAGYGAEVSAPTCTITTDGGAGAGVNFSTFAGSVALAGTAKGGAAAADPGGFHPVHYVSWSNSLTGQSGKCRLAYINELIGTGQWDPGDSGKAPQTGLRLQWHMNWSKPLVGDRPITLAVGANVITVTVVDNHGNTATDTITITRTSGLGLIQSASVAVTVVPAQVTMGTPVVAGNLLVALFGLTNTAAQLDTVTMAPSGWQKIVHVQHASETRVLAMYMKLAAGGETGFEFSKLSGSGSATLSVMEFNGYVAPVPDKTNSNAPAGTTLTSVQTGTTGTLSEAAEIVVAAALQHVSNGGGETIDSAFTLVGAADLARMVVGYKVTAATTALNPSLGWTTPAGAAGLIASFRESPVPVPRKPPKRLRR